MENIAKQISKNLGGFTEYVKKQLNLEGVEIQFNVKASAKYVEIESENLKDNEQVCGKLGSALYREFVINTWGGVLVQGGDIIYFRPMIHFQYTQGGSNGHEVAPTIYFDLEKNEWFVNE